MHCENSKKPVDDESLPKQAKSNNFSKLKHLWYKNSSWTRLKVEENDFRTILLKHAHQSSPQAIQGMWQAYGQMRAARTTAKGAIIATGVLGAGLLLYQKLLSRQEKDLKAQKNDLIKREKMVKDREDISQEFFLSYRTIAAKFELADGEIKKTYDDKPDKIKAYEEAKTQVEKQAFDEAKQDKQKYYSKESSNNSNRFTR
jgi:hypothetical protein